MFYILVGILLSFGVSANVCDSAQDVYGHNANGVDFKTGADVCKLPEELKKDPERKKQIQEYLNEHCIVMVPGFIYTKERLDHFGRVGWDWTVGLIPGLESESKDTPIPFKSHIKELKGTWNMWWEDEYKEVRDTTLTKKIKSIEDVADEVYAEMKKMSEKPQCKKGFLLFGHSKGGATIQQLLNARSEQKEFLRQKIVGGATISPTLNGSPMADLVIASAKKKVDPDYKPTRYQRHVMKVFKEFKRKARSDEAKRAVAGLEEAIERTAETIVEQEGAEKPGQLIRAFKGISVEGAARRHRLNGQTGRHRVFTGSKSPVANLTLSTQLAGDTSEFFKDMARQERNPSGALNDRLSRLLDQIEKDRTTLNNTTHVCEMGHRGNVNGDGSQCTLGLMIQAVESAMAATNEYRGTTPSSETQKDKKTRLHIH